MKLVKVYSGRFIVAAPVLDEKSPECKTSEAQTYLMNVSSDMQASARGMYTLFERYGMDGRKLLPSNVFHEANKEEGIWQFIKGRLRLFCFIDESGALLILSHGTVKKTQKADRYEVAKAVRLKEQYLRDKEANCIEWIE